MKIIISSSKPENEDLSNRKKSNYYPFNSEYSTGPLQISPNIISVYDDCICFRRGVKRNTVIFCFLFFSQPTPTRKTKHLNIMRTESLRVLGFWFISLLWTISESCLY